MPSAFAPKDLTAQFRFIFGAVLDPVFRVHAGKALSVDCFLARPWPSIGHTDKHAMSNNKRFPFVIDGATKPAHLCLNAAAVLRFPANLGLIGPNPWSF